MIDIKQTIERCFSWMGRHPLGFINLAIAIFALTLVPISMNNTQFGTWLWIIIGVIVIVLVAWYAWYYDLQRSRVYFYIILSNTDGYIRRIEKSIKQYFDNNNIAAARQNKVISIHGYEKSEWPNLFDQAMDRLHRVRSGYREVHLVSNSPWQWNLAIGTELCETPIRIYKESSSSELEERNTSLHLIGSLNRSLRTRLPNPESHCEVCSALRKDKDGDSQEHRALSVSISQNNHLNAIRDYVEQNYPEQELWYTAFLDDLSLNRPDDWQDAAIDVASCIEHLSEGGKYQIWLYGAMPDALGVMVGAALGPQRSVRLMQYKRHERIYEEYLQIPM